MSITARRGLLSTEAAARRMPYDPPFTTSELLTIEAALLRAWGTLKEDVTLDIEELGEVEISLRLVGVLDILMNDVEEPVPGFSGDCFETPIRGGELQDYSGKNIEKRPDIVFRRVGRTPGVQKQFWGLFVECKRVGPRHTVANYYRDGLCRFVDGHYAWAVSVSMMLAYASEGYKLPKSIEKHFRRKGVTDTYGQRGKLSKSAESAESECWTSVHDRSWSYRQPGLSDPGPITVLHLWLPMSRTER